jgi:hypothetical protein
MTLSTPLARFAPHGQPCGQGCKTKSAAFCEANLRASLSQWRAIHCGKQSTTVVQWVTTKLQKGEPVDVAFMAREINPEPDRHVMGSIKDTTRSRHAKIRADASVQTPPVAAAPALPSAATPTSAPIAEATGERRHITVMFCDLVGSSSISAALDAEDWRDLVGAYLDAASAAVTEMGGYVASTSTTATACRRKLGHDHRSCD